MMRKRFGLAIAMLWLAHPLPAMDLNEVVQTALQRHPSLQSVSADVAAAAARVEGVRARFRPSVKATLGWTQLDESPSFTVSPLGTIVFGQKDNPQLSLLAQKPLFTGGKLEGALRQARSGRQVAERQRERERQRVELEAVSAYYRLQQARRLVKVAEDQLAALTKQRDDVRRMLEQGVVAKIDLLRMETAVAGAKERLTRARNGEAVALAALANAMGLESPDGLQVETPEDVDLRGETIPDTADAAIAEALRQRPEQRRLEAMREATEGAVQVARSGRKPSVGVFAQYDIERATFMPETGDWAVGVMVEMNLFDGGLTRAAVTEAESQRAKIDAARRQLRNGIALQVRAAYLDWTSARARVAAAEKAVDSAREGLRLVDMGYRREVNTITDLLSARAELTQAETNLAVARYDARVAEAKLRFAMGREWNDAP